MPHTAVCLTGVCPCQAVSHTKTHIHARTHTHIPRSACVIIFAVLVLFRASCCHNSLLIDVNLCFFDALLLYPEIKKYKQTLPVTQAQSKTRIKRTERGGSAATSPTCFLLGFLWHLAIRKRKIERGGMRRRRNIATAHGRFVIICVLLFVLGYQACCLPLDLLAPPLHCPVRLLLLPG